MSKKMFSKYVLSFSYEDYRYSVGGTNKAIIAQKKIINSKDFSFIFICPFRLFGKPDCNRWLVRVESSTYALTTDGLINYLLKLSKRDGAIFEGIIVHHFLNINLSALKRILDCFDGRIIVYLHDFYSICPSTKGTLMKQNGLLCDKAMLHIEQCSSCPDYNKSRKKQIDAFASYLCKRSLFIAPSDSCRNVWIKSFSDFKPEVKVIYHQKPVGLFLRKDSTEYPIKVAFLGTQTYSKGWDDFKLVVSQTKELPYSFFSFSKKAEFMPSITNYEIDFHDGLDSMIKALRKHEIDIVLLLSKWPETFSYTLYESMCAGCFIFCYPCSGNIANQVLLRKNGMVFNSALDIISFLKKPDLIKEELNTFKKSSFPETLIDDDSFVKYLCPCSFSYNGGAKIIFNLSWFFVSLYKIKYFFKKVFKH